MAVQEVTCQEMSLSRGSAPCQASLQQLACREPSTWCWCDQFQVTASADEAPAKPREADTGEDVTDPTRREAEGRMPWTEAFSVARTRLWVLVPGGAGSSTLLSAKCCSGEDL